MRKIFFMICVLTLVGCSMAPLGHNVIRQTPDNVTNTKQIAVAKFIDAVEQGAVIGKAYGGLGCIPNGDLYWKGNEKMMGNVTNAVMVKLERYGYYSIGKVNSPFNEEFSKQSELLLGGKLIDIKSNMCISLSGVKGETYIKIEWQIYDNKKYEVIFKINTEGYAIEQSFNKLGDKDKFERAIDMAIDNLLADKAFVSFVTARN